MVMTGHIVLPGLDKSGTPASHSYAISTELLRNELGFNGIIVTDGMEMGGLTKSAWAGESAVRAIEAGADILLLPLYHELWETNSVSENSMSPSPEKSETARKKSFLCFHFEVAIALTTFFFKGYVISNSSLKGRSTNQTATMG